MSDNKLVVEPTGKGLYRIKYTGGGPAPALLSGQYTSRTTAEEAVVMFQKTVQASPHIKYPKADKGTQVDAKA